MKRVQKSTWYILLLILIIAFLFRVYHLEAKQAGTDEKWTFMMMNQILNGTFLQNAGTHAHPPFFYALLTPLWYVSNSSILALQLFIVLLSLLSIGLTFVLAKKVFTTRIALLASFLSALSPFHILYSQHLRSYILLMILFPSSLLLIMHYLQKKDTRTFIPLTIIYIIAFYSHIFAAFFIIAQFASLFLLRVFKLSDIQLKPVLLSGIVTGIGWAFWIPTFLKQYTVNITKGAINTISTLNPIHIPYTFYKYAVAMNLSYTVKHHFYAAIICALIIVLLVLYAFFILFHESKKYFIILGGTFFLPTFLLAFIGIFFPLYSFRYLSYLVPIFLIMLAKGIIDLKNENLRFLLFLGIILIWVRIIAIYWHLFTLPHWALYFAV